MTASSGVTVGEALRRFRVANGLRADEATHASWACRIGPLQLRLPNFAWRRNAILAHDLHHLVTRYPCTLRGECQMAAWEFGAGPMPHRAAVLFCLPLVVMGLFWSPRRIWQAFRAGQASRSLHSLAAIDCLLGRPLASVRRDLEIRQRDRTIWLSIAHFAILVLQGLAIVSAPAGLLIGAWAFLLT